MMNRDEVVKAFTPVEAKFLGETQKVVLGKLQAEFLDLATTLELDVPVGPVRTRALNYLLLCKLLCNEAVAHQGYSTSKKEQTNAKK